MANSGYVYKVGNGGVAISTAITILQIKAGAAPLEILRAALTQGLSETSTQERVQILRKTAAATVTSATPLKVNPNDPAALAVGGTAATGYTASAEGTDGDVLVDRGFNILNGFEWIATPEERILVDASGFVALKFPVAPASATFIAEIWFRELR